MKPLMQQAQEQEPAAGTFKKPDIGQFVPDGIKDAVARVIAAGHRILYGQEMAQEVQAAIDSPDPVPKKLADNTAGLLLTLDQQSQGGIPEAAIFPAGMELLGEAAEVLQAAGQTVTQEDYNEAARMLYVTLGQKLGLGEDQLMGAAQQAVGGGGDEEQGEPPDDEGAEGEGGMPMPGAMERA